MTREQLLEKIRAEFSEVEPAAEATEVKPYLTVKVPAEKLRELVGWLRDKQGFNYLDMVTAVDWLGPVSQDGFIQDPNPNPNLPEGAVPQVTVGAKNPKVEYKEAFEMVYLLTNLQARLKVVLRAELPRAAAKIDSLTGLFKSADWQERETIDLFGIGFEGHPNPTKILTPDFIEGHPLRKDYAHKKDRFD